MLVSVRLSVSSVLFASVEALVNVAAKDDVARRKILLLLLL